MFIFDLKFSNLHLGDHGVLHGWSLSNKLLTRTLLQEKYTRLNDPELVLAPDIVPSSLVFRIRILGHPGAVSRVDKMFVVKVYCKIETSKTFTTNILSTRLTAPGSPRM